MFDRKELRKKVEEEEQKRDSQESIPDEDEEDYDTAQDERADKLRDMMRVENKWDASGLKPNTRRKKIGIALLVIGLVGYLILQYVVKG